MSVPRHGRYDGVELTFIDESLPPGIESVRDRELKRALALSHSAIASHRKKLRLQQRRVSTEKGSQSVKLRPVSERDDRHHLKDIEAGTFAYPASSKSKTRRYRSSEGGEEACGCDDKLAIVHQRNHHGHRTSPSRYSFEPDAVATQSAIYFYQHIAAVNQCVVNSILNVQNCAGPGLFQLLLHPDIKPVTAACLDLMVHKLTRPTERVPRRIYKNVGRCLGLLQNRLRQGQIDEVTIISSLQLSGITKTYGDDHTFQIHRAGLKKLLGTAVYLRDDISTARTAQWLVRQWDCCWALEHGTSPMFPQSAQSPRFPAFPFIPHVQSMVFKLPIGFQELARQRKLALDALQVLERVADGIEIWNSPSTKSPPHQTHDSHTTTEAKYFTLWDACPSMVSAQEPDGRPSLSRLVVLASIVYALNVFTLRKGVTNAYYFLAQKLLIKDIPRAMPARDDEQSVMIWVVMNGIDAWANLECILTPEGSKLLTLMKSCFAELSICKLRKQLKLFFCEEEFERRCIIYWSTSQ